MFNLDQFCKEKFYEQGLVDKIKGLSLVDSAAITELLTSLQPNANVFRQILSLLQEISIAQSKSFTEILASFELKDANRKEKQIQLRSQLEQMRFPMRFKIQKKLESCVEQISKDYGVSIVLPEELEGETVEIKFKVRGVKELKVKSEKIQALVQSDACNQIFNILEGKDL